MFCQAWKPSRNPSLPHTKEQFLETVLAELGAVPVDPETCGVCPGESAGVGSGDGARGHRLTHALGASGFATTVSASVGADGRTRRSLRELATDDLLAIRICAA